MSEIKTSNPSRPTSNHNKIWTITELLRWSTDYLKEKGFQEARLNSELLLSHTLNCSRIDLYTRFDRPLGKDELTVFKALFKRRLDHEPLQYIIGESEFMGLKFFVDKRVLIPRQETEVLVEETINISRTFEGNINILDIGVGSGNIAVSLTKFIDKASVTGIDVSADSLVVARLNVDRYALNDKVKLHHQNIFDEIKLDTKFDIIVSNPPYISSDEMKDVQPEVAEYEPLIATTDNQDGLTYYKRIVEVGKALLKPGGWLLFEIAYNQKEDVFELFSNSGYSSIDAIKDYGGNFRVVRGRF